MPVTFSDYFINKIVTIRTKLQSINSQSPPLSLIQLNDWEPEFRGEKLTAFTPTNEEEIRRMIMAAPSKSCELDPTPTSIIKGGLDEIAPLATKLVNASLSGACVPDKLKHAIVRPLLKKQHLNNDTLKNYRPVSNLPFVSKIIEKVVSLPLGDHIQSNNLADPLQSAYRPAHSTETALVKVHSDISKLVDDRQVVILVIMLDLSAAFDTLDHTIMLDRLWRMYGIDEQALKWISSYLDSRTQSVHVNGSKSQPKTMTFAMPQGSVLGAVFYVYYSKPVGLIIRSHKMEYHCYADDSQLYIVLNQANVNETIHRVENCVSDIQTWMERNLLKLNEDKTEIILFSKKSMENLFGNISLSFGGSVIQPVKKVKNLGCWLDNTLSMDTHAQAIVRSCYFQLRKIKHIRQYLSIIHSLVISKLDYSNALLAGAPKTVTNTLQRVQHMAARVVAGLRK